MTDPVVVGIIDSGAHPRQLGLLQAMRRFSAGPAGHVEAFDDACDRVGHGTETVDIVLQAEPPPGLMVAQVFDDALTTSALRVSAALDWLAGEGARLINMSLGLAHDRDVLRQACARAHGAGAILVASAPARGGPVYPAAYDRVVSVTGDARCAVGEVSDLLGRQADFGTFGGAPSGPQVRAGASVAAAQFTTLAAAYLAVHGNADAGALKEHFRARADYHGPERRGAVSGDG
ncbi:MAG: subtilisin-like serine protease QhpE [Hyphomicrobiales bacterium]